MTVKETEHDTFTEEMDLGGEDNSPTQQASWLMIHVLSTKPEAGLTPKLRKAHDMQTA